MASTPRQLDRKSGEWRDGEAMLDEVNKVRRDSGGSAPAADPWAGAPVPAGVGAGTSDEPPF